MKKLNENIFAGDLEGVIRPVVSIDDFVSKIDDKTLVIAFYAKHNEAADDLSIFLEKSSITKILDTEISSGINKDGDVLVFVEIDFSDKNIEEAGNTIDSILKIASKVTGINEWKIKNMRFLGKKLYKYSKSNVVKLLRKSFK